MCSYGECLEQVQVTKALSFSCSNCVRMNSSILLKLNLNPRHVGTSQNWVTGTCHTGSLGAVQVQVTATRLPRDRIQASSGSMR